VIARLQRFYGGSLEIWLDFTPAVLEVFFDEMQIIGAEERLANMNDISCASGLLKSAEAARYRARLEQAAYAGIKGDVPPEVNRAMLEAAGIIVERVEKGNA